MLMLLAILIQEGPTLTLRDVAARAAGEGAVVTVEADTSLPDGAVVTLSARLVRHVLEPQLNDRLTPGRPGEGTTPQVVKTTGGRLPKTAIELPTPGIYELAAAFDPVKQEHAARMKRLLGRFYLRHDFPAVRIVAGDSERLLRALYADGSNAARRIDACRALFDRLEKESRAADWPERTLKVLESIRKEQERCAKESEGSLLNATFGFVALILEDLDTARKNIEELLRQREKDAKAPPAPPSGPKDDPKGIHSGDPTDTAIGSAASGRPMTLDRLRELIDRADAVRVRETLSWTVQFALRPGAAAKAIREGIDGLAADPSKARRELFTTWDPGCAELLALLGRGDDPAPFAERALKRLAGGAP
jgi:hypothetical protein